MTDYFALLDQPRRPWLDGDELKEQFQARSTAAHPDRIHNATPEEKAGATQRFTVLNAAFNCLKEPRHRVRHLVELELGRKPGDLKNVPGELVDAFMQIAATGRTVETLARERAQIQSPMLQAEFFERVQPQLEILESLQKRISDLEARAIEQLRGLDAAWDHSDQRAVLLPQLEELAQTLGFHGRWRAQLQEAHLRLTL